MLPTGTTFNLPPKVADIFGTLKKLELHLLLGMACKTLVKKKNHN